MLSQISVLVKNEPGQLAKLMKLIAGANINCLGISTYDSADFGAFHIVVDDSGKCMDVLTDKGYSCVERICIGVELDDVVGYLDRLLTTLGNANISIDCIFTLFNKNTNKAVLIFRTEDMDAVEILLSANDYRIIKNIGELC